MKKGKKHENLICTICDTDIEVPMCRGREMAIKGGELICDLCGSEKTIPVCCGRQMAVAGGQ